MSELLTIPGLSQPFAELLEAAGFRDFKDLALAEDKALARELARANRILKIVESAPSQSMVADWVRHAREQAGVTEEDPELVVVDYEKDRKVAANLTASPWAIPLPGNALKDKGLSVPDIPSGFLLSEYPGALDMRVERRIPNARRDAPFHVNHLHVASGGAESKLEIDVSRLKSLDDLGPARPRAHAHGTSAGARGQLPLETEGEDRIALLRAPRASTNKGRNPNSRRYIRGVLHNQPGGLYMGSFLTLLLVVLGPLAVVAAFLLLLSREMPARFGWVPEWWLAFPIALPVIALGWLLWGFSGKCRVCGQKLFIRRPHLKNPKAHYVRGLGYVLPLCLHILLFHWFRCSHCGTPVRLKK